MLAAHWGQGGAAPRLLTQRCDRGVGPALGARTGPFAGAGPPCAGYSRAHEYPRARLVTCCECLPHRARFRGVTTHHGGVCACGATESRAKRGLRDKARRRCGQLPTPGCPPAVSVVCASSLSEPVHLTWTGSLFCGVARCVVTRCPLRQRAGDVLRTKTAVSARFE